jgi:hypothetical protein
VIRLSFFTPIPHNLKLGGYGKRLLLAPLKCTNNGLLYNIKVMYLKQGIFAEAAKNEGIGLPPSQRTSVTFGSLT